MTAGERRRGGRVMVAVIAAAAAAASGVPSWAGPIEDGRRAAETLAFTADVAVTWVDGRGRHETRLTVSARDGVLHFDGPADLSAQGERRLVSHGTVWEELWGDALVPFAPPPVSRKYRMRMAPGGVAAGRPSHVVELSAGGTVRERLAVDDATGLVLRREVLDDLGRTVRLVEVERLELGGGGRPAGAAVPVGVTLVPAPARLMRAAVPRPLRAPAVLDGGFEEVAVYRRGRIVHTLYSDGLHTLSVFAQPGRLDRRGLPGGGDVVRVGRWAAVAYPWPGGEALTWEARGVVYTVVGDGARGELVAAAASMPGPGGLGLVPRLRRVCRVVAETLSGGR